MLVHENDRQCPTISSVSAAAFVLRCHHRFFGGGGTARSGRETVAVTAAGASVWRRSNARNAGAAPHHRIDTNPASCQLATSSAPPLSSIQERRRGAAGAAMDQGRRASRLGCSAARNRRQAFAMLARADRDHRRHMIRSAEDRTARLDFLRERKIQALRWARTIPRRHAAIVEFYMRGKAAPGRLGSRPS